jgi:tripartite-type tricarboxylate transporter receptor subunit TctC
MRASTRVRLIPTIKSEPQNMISRFRACTAQLTFAAFCCSATVHAADAARDYPQRPVRVVSPFTAGGNTDIIARILAPRLSERLGQNIIVDNRPGAGSVTGSNHVAKATPDGHTLLALSGAFTATSSAVKTLPYDPLKDFAWITLIMTYPFAVVVKAESPMQSIGDLISNAKKNPGKLNYGTVGTGSVFHLAAELFNVMAGTETTHIPYKGGAEPVTELIAGRIDVIFITLTGATPYIQSGRLRPLAVASLQRAAQFPNVPTVTETLRGYEVTSFAGMAAPAGTPRPIVERLNREFRAVLAQPDINKRLSDLGGDVTPTSPEQMARHITDEITKWKRIVVARKIEID